MYIEKLISIVGGKNIITDKAYMVDYSHDETSAAQYSSFPEVVVFPEDSTQIAAILKLANEELIPVTPRGGGTGLSGGAIPVKGGIVLSLAKMNRILELDSENMTITVQAGVITNDICTAAAAQGLYYAGYPMSLQSCFIGGNVAENAGGGKAVKYGVTGRYVMALEVVTPTGEIIKLGGKSVKDVAGYDLKSLIIGSEGTLGIVTEITLKLLPLPVAEVVILALFADIDTAVAAVPRIMIDTGIIPAGIEFMDITTVRVASDFINERLPVTESEAMLLISLDEQSADRLEEQYLQIGEICEENGAIDVFIADNVATRERIWKIRRSIPEALKALYPHQSSEDIVVPISAISQLITQLQQIAIKHSIQIPCFGHAGDGNIHATLINNKELTESEWYQVQDQVLKDIYKVVLELGGSITGEHGVGFKRKKYFEENVSPVQLELMKKIKLAFDPNNIMNPGKIFDM